MSNYSFEVADINKIPHKKPVTSEVKELLDSFLCSNADCIEVTRYPQKGVEAARKTFYDVIRRHKMDLRPIVRSNRLYVLKEKRVW